MQKRVLSLLVDNTAGVTTRVSGLFSRRGYNIDSITGGETADERFSRITVVCSGDELILEQIPNQLAKLVDVRDIKILEPDNSVCHELMMILSINFSHKNKCLSVTAFVKSRLLI